jgi:hypothetical protein
VVLVAEVACRLPGCPPLETVVAFWTEDERRHQFKLYKPVADVVYDDIGWLIGSPYEPRRHPMGLLLSPLPHFVVRDPKRTHVDAAHQSGFHVRIILRERHGRRLSRASTMISDPAIRRCRRDRARRVSPLRPSLSSCA